MTTSFDGTALLEEVLDILDRRGIRPTRLRVGDIEVEVGAFTPSQPLSAALSSATAPPADPSTTIHVPLDRQTLYGTPSLWPTGQMPTFKKAE